MAVNPPGDLYCHRNRDRNPNWLKLVLLQLRICCYLKVIASVHDPSAA